MDEKIYIIILKLFGDKGTRFTTEDLAKELGTSKRTIYTYFSNKDEMIEKTIDFVFEDLLSSDIKILNDQTLTNQEKVKLCFQYIPDAYNVGSIIRHMDDLNRYYPVLCEKVNHNLEIMWNTMIKLVEQGIQDGELREVDPTMLKMILKESLKKLLDYEFIEKNQLSFEAGIKAMNNIILYGLMKREP
jgi:Transcriptional regulator